MKLKDQGLREAVNSVNLRRSANTGLHQLGEPDEDEEQPHQLNLNPYELPDKNTINMESSNAPYGFKDSHFLAQANHDRYYETAKAADTFARETNGTSELLRKDLYQYYSSQNPEKTIDPIVKANLMNYKYEAIDIAMSHTLAYSSGYTQKQNVIWNQEERYIGYTFESIVIIEKLNVERTQKFLKEGNDALSDLKLSPNGKMLLAHSHSSKVDGLPMIYIWDAHTFKKISEISINQRTIVAVDFSPNSNLLLVVSFDDTDDENPNSVVAIWDFTDGNCEPLCRSHIPYEVKGAAWNYFLKSLEFSTYNDTSYDFWKVKEDLTLHTQSGSVQFDLTSEEVKEGDRPFRAHRLGYEEGQSQITCMNFAYPLESIQTVFLLIGLSNGYCWTVDTRTNTLISQVKIAETSLTQVQPKRHYIVA